MVTVYRTLAFVLTLAITSTSWGQSDPAPSFAYPSTSQDELLFPELPPAPTEVPAPVAPAPRPAMVAPQMQRLSPSETAHLPNQVQNFIDFYGAGTSARALQQLPSRPSTAYTGGSQMPQVQQAAKPFEGRVSTPPTVSPYLNLFREESEEALPNYFTFVRPMQQQMQTNLTTHNQLNNIQSNVRQASYQQATATNGSTPVTGHGTRYLNTNGYYPTVRRLR